MPLTLGDEIESKTGSGAGPKFYHAECYDEYHLQFNHEGRILNGTGNIIREKRRGEAPG